MVLAPIMDAQAIAAEPSYADRIVTGACDLVDTTIFHFADPPGLYNQVVYSHSTTYAFHNKHRVWKLPPVSMVGSRGLEPLTPCV